MPEETRTTNGWNEWSKVVLTELERLTDSNKEIVEEFQKFKVEVAKEIASKREVENIRQELANFKLDQSESLNNAKADLTKEISNLKSEYGKEISNIKSEHDKEISILKTDHSIQLTKLATELKIKAGVWGAAGSLIGVLVMGAMAIFGMS